MSISVPELHLRPHHLLCLQTFIGYGYSEEFVRQMTAVKHQLADFPDAPVRIVRGTDMLCSHCPNCRKGHCKSDKPGQFDQLVMAKIEKSVNLLSSSGPSANCSAASADSFLLHGIPKYLILTNALLEECCPGCEWKDLCCKVINEKSDV